MTTDRVLELEARVSELEAEIAEFDSTENAYIKAGSDLAEQNTALSSAIIAMVRDGWLFCGPEGMSEAQQQCYAAYLLITNNQEKGNGL